MSGPVDSIAVTIGGTGCTVSCVIGASVRPGEAFFEPGRGIVVLAAVRSGDRGVRGGELTLDFDAPQDVAVAPCSVWRGLYGAPFRGECPRADGNGLSNVSPLRSLSTWRTKTRGFGQRRVSSFENIVTDPVCKLFTVTSKAARRGNSTLSCKHPKLFNDVHIFARPVNGFPTIFVWADLTWKASRTNWKYSVYLSGSYRA